MALVQTGRAVDWASALPDEQATIPKRIAERLLELGRAYGLHYLSALNSVEQNRMPTTPQALTLSSPYRYWYALTRPVRVAPLSSSTSTEPAHEPASRPCAARRFAAAACFRTHASALECSAFDLRD